MHSHMHMNMCAHICTHTRAHKHMYTPTCTLRSPAFPGDEDRRQPRPARVGPDPPPGPGRGRDSVHRASLGAAALPQGPPGPHRPPGGGGWPPQVCRGERGGAEGRAAPVASSDASASCRAGVGREGAAQPRGQMAGTWDLPVGTERVRGQRPGQFPRGRSLGEPGSLPTGGLVPLGRTLGGHLCKVPSTQ